MKTSLKITVAVVSVAIVVVGALAIMGSSNHMSGDVKLNYTYEDQLILDKSGSGSMTPDKNMIFCVVSYTIENNTSRNVDYWSSDVSLKIGNLSYGHEILYVHDDGSWTIESGAIHHGVYAFEVPEDHAEPIFSLGLDESFDESLPVNAVPEREAGQVYGLIYSNVGKPFMGSLVVSIIIRNISYETTISNNPYNFKLTDGRGVISYSLDTYHISGNDLDQEIPPGEVSKLFYLTFDVPTGWDDGRELNLSWNGYPERGMEYTSNITEI